MMAGFFVGARDEQIETLHADPDAVLPFLKEHVSSAQMLEVDKDWFAIHFLLTGEPYSASMPLGFILSGKSVGEVDVGYGPARAFTSAQVREIATALLDLSVDTLLKRWDQAALSEIYAIEVSEHEGRQNVAERYGALRSMIMTLAERRLGMVHGVW